MGEADLSSLLFAGRPHQVTLTKAYCMDRTEVTNAQFYAVLQAGKCEYPRVSTRGTMAKHYPNQPVDYVNWDDAQCYCRVKGGRLPTEAEWEFAARGTDGRVYPWGNEAPTDEHQYIQRKVGTPTLADVGTHPKGRSAFGLDDMAGNLGEWTADPCLAYSGPATVDPTSGDSPSEHGPECRVVKGSSWASKLQNRAHAATRTPASRTMRDSQTGVRCAYEPK
jgi:formylglycine-generating enzyme required for sulfatase activity